MGERCQHDLGGVLAFKEKTYSTATQQVTEEHLIPKSSAFQEAQLNIHFPLSFPHLCHAFCSLRFGPCSFPASRILEKASYLNHLIAPDTCVQLQTLHLRNARTQTPVLTCRNIEASINFPLVYIRDPAAHHTPD